MRITKITINDTEIKPKNLVLILGANSTGKTRLLDEMHSVFTDRKRSTAFWDINFEYRIYKYDKENWYKSLNQNVEGKQIQWYCPFTIYNNQPDGHILQDQNYEDLKEQKKFKPYFSNPEFLRKEFIHYLQVPNRLTVPNNVSITAQSQKTSDSLNLLYRTPKMFKEIKGHLNRLFDKQLHTALHGNPQLELRLSDKEDEAIPKWRPNDPQKSFQEYQKWIKDNSIGDISVEGHGIQAFLHIMLSYAIPTNTVLMIDEPEIHLYPSIKRKFGALLGKIAGQNDKQFICVTHDSDFLQGVFDSKCDLTIIKLSRTNKKYSLIYSQYNRNNRLRASQIQTQFLQIPFLDFAVIVEGANDRMVYEYVFNDKKLLNEIEYKFIAAGGKDSVTNPEKVANDLSVPYAMIFDIDVLKKGNFKHFSKILKLKNKKVIKKRVKVLGEKINGIANFKIKGINAVLNNIVKIELGNLLSDLEQEGIFFVPIGCLESWCEIKSDKGEYPDKLIKKYHRSKKDFTDMIDFLRRIENYYKKYPNK